MLTLDSQVLDTACRPANAQHPVGGGRGLWIGWRIRPWRLPSSIARGHPTRCRPEAAVLAGGYPLRVVRVAPLHDAGITAWRTTR